jgi:hypothetical protein
VKLGIQVDCIQILDVTFLNVNCKHDGSKKI